MVLFRKQQFENQLMMNTWKVKWEDIELWKTGKSKEGSTVCAALFHIRQKPASIVYSRRGHGSDPSTGRVGLG